MSLFRRCAVVFALSLLAACGGDTEDIPELPACGVAAATGPYVKSVSPADGESRTLRLPYFKIVMSEEIPCGENAAPRISLTQSGQTVALGAIKCGGNPTALTFQPTAPLLYDAAATLRIEGLVDGTEAIPACQVTFTTKTKTAALVTSDGLTLARDVDGTLWSWGDALNAGLDGHSVPREVPEKVALGGKVVSMATGGQFALVALEDGTAWAWGDNTRGQLGNGSTTTAAAPVKVALPVGAKVVDVAAGSTHALAVTSEGKVYGWGENRSGETGSGTQTDKETTPVEVPGLTDVAALEAGNGSSGNGAVEGYFSLALKKDGSVWGWGANNAGQVGQANPGNPAVYLAPTKLNIPASKAIAGGSNNSYSLDASGTVTAWGDTMYGAAGDGTCHEGARMPVAVTGLDGVTALSAGGQFGMALRTDGTLWVWGNNSEGVVGDGTTGVLAQCNGAFDDDHSQLAPKQTPDLTGVAGVAAGFHQALVVKTDGTVLATGYNTNGKLGIGPNVVQLAGTAIVATYQVVPGM